MKPYSLNPKSLKKIITLSSVVRNLNKEFARAACGKGEPVQRLLKGQNEIGLNIDRTPRTRC